MVTCELCGKEVKTTQGLRGHKTFQHGFTGNSTRQSVARVATEQQVSLLEDRLQKLERVTGLRDSDLLESLTDSPLPFTEQLSKQAEQVSKLSDIVSKLSEDVELAEVSKLAEQDRALEDLRDRFDLKLNSLAAVVNKYRDAFNHDLADMETGIDKVHKMVDDLGEGLSMIRTKLTAHGHDNLKYVPELVAKVGKLEDAIGIVQSRVEYLSNVTKRWPTGDWVKLTLTDDKEHTFREYKSTWGLARPRQTSSDFIFGSRWVDLAEPED